MWVLDKETKCNKRRNKCNKLCQATMIIWQSIHNHIPRCPYQSFPFPWNPQFWQSFFSIYFPWPLFRQRPNNLNLLIYFLFFCTTCFDHKALFTCCLKLYWFVSTSTGSESGGWVKSQNNNDEKSESTTTVWLVDSSETAFKNQSPSGAFVPLVISSPQTPPDSSFSTVHSPSLLCCSPTPRWPNNQTMQHQGWPRHPPQCTVQWGWPRCLVVLNFLAVGPSTWTPPPWWQNEVEDPPPPLRRAIYFFGITKLSAAFLVV